MLEMNLEETIKNIPAKSGVYLMKDTAGVIIYVGKSANLKDRVRSYFLEKSRYDRKVAALVPKIADIEIITTKNEMEALILESKLIKKYKPKYNVLFKDDKTYPYIKISTAEPFPRMVLTRRVLPDGSRYFGPYVFGSVREIIKVIQKNFKLRDCRLPLPSLEGKKPKRACLKADIGFCSVPCLEKVTRKQYGTQVSEVIKFLSGKQKELLAKIDERMQKSSEKLEYEDAARLRDQKELVALISFQNENNTEGAKSAQADSRDNQTEKAIFDLKEALKLDVLPLVIEGADISNTSGTNSVGSVVRFYNGFPDKAGYRKFRIKTVFGPDDINMLKEVLTRKYTRAVKDNNMPDLILIDGGRGQLNAAKEILDLLGTKVPVISLAKREEEIYTLNASAPLRLKKETAALHLLQYVRDEAHRFAGSYHKTLRAKELTNSRLDSISGVGAKTKMLILRQIKDVNKMTALEIDALKDIPENIKLKLKGTLK